MLKKIKKFLIKLGFIDLLGISLFFITLIIAALFFLRESSYVYVTLEISSGNNSFQNLWFYKPTDWYIENLKINMKNKDLFKIDDLELIDILYYPNLDFKISEQTVFVTLKVKTTFNKRNNQYLYQGQPLLVGDHHIFKIGSTVIPGVIHNINTSFFEPKTQKILVEGTLENEDNEEIERDAEVRFVGVKNYFIDGVNSGSIIKNNKGKVIAEIIRIDKSAGYKEFIYNNSLIKIIDPERKQANILLELDVSKVNNHYFYRREDKIVLGKKIPLSFDNFNIYFKIEKILD